MESPQGKEAPCVKEGKTVQVPLERGQVRFVPPKSKQETV